MNMFKIFPMVVSLLLLPFFLNGMIGDTPINWEELALGKENVSPHVFLSDGTRVYAKNQDRVVHCESLDNCFEKFSKNNNYLGELAFAFDPYLHKSNAVNHKKKLVQLIANKDKNRNKWIRLMDEHDCFPDIYGNYFNKSSYLLSHPLKIHPPINFKKQNKIYSKYLISLNIHASVIKNGTNMKTFEACGFRVPQIINYTAGLENFFEPNKEIMVFSTIEEYVDKLNLLKKDKNIRNKLIVNSLKRAMEEHKYDDRVKMIINNIRLS